jgi:uncharacterized protein with HEPN domain
MPRRDDVVRLRHMLDAAQKAQQLIKGRSRAEIERDETLTLALVRLLEIIGEAAKNVSPETRQRRQEIPWKEIAGTRDRLIHGYFDVDWNVLWDILSADLPPLISALESALATSE